MHHAGTIVNAVAILFVTMALIWFGLRPAMKAILEARPLPSAPVEGIAPPEAAPGASRPWPRTSPPRRSPTDDLTSPKAIAPPRSGLSNWSDYDEEQAAAMLKDWMRGAQSRMSPPSPALSLTSRFRTTGASIQVSGPKRRLSAMP